ncbi:hypothetical protein GGR53DRAFT_462027 [Hypoxylon sp. FL1150]|nr:hypothetical protein GGR53DRAFT_462027 [Hypoxylon sp. FL1150]
MPRARFVLGDTLAVAQNLVDPWGTVNGSASADAHMDAWTLCCMVDAIGLVLRDHEIAIDAAASRAPKPNTHNGRVELDAPKAVVVAQEALKHLLVRLATMLQDIEEESASRIGAGIENHWETGTPRARLTGCCGYWGR